MRDEDTDTPFEFTSIKVGLPLSIEFRNAFHIEVENLRRSVIQLFSYKKGQRPKPESSATLISIGIIHFLVTAGHVADKTLSTDLCFLDKDEKLQHLNGNFHRHPSADVAFKVLDLQELAYFEFANFLTPNDFASSKLIGSNIFGAVVGYPVSRNNLRGSSPPKMDAIWLEGEWSEEDILSFPFDFKAKNFSTDFGGYHSRSPVPTGMSGGAIFACPDHGRLSRMVVPPKFCGIGTDWKAGSKVITGHGIATLLKFMLSG